MRGRARRMTAATLSLALMAGSLAACGQPANTGASTTEGSATEAASQIVTPTAEEIASWKTLGEALATMTSQMATTGYDDKYYVCTFEAGEATLRVVAKMEGGIDEKLAGLDFFAGDYNDQLIQVVGGLQIVSAEDITADKVSLEDLNALVGKTGQELMDAGYVFSSYFFYGGGQTGATFDRGHFSYNFTFNTSISEEQANNDKVGELVKTAVLAEVDYAGTSDSATDPTAIEQTAS